MNVSYLVKNVNIFKVGYLLVHTSSNVIGDLKQINFLEGLHALLFERNKIQKINLMVTRNIEFIPKAFSPWIKFLVPLLSPFKRLLVK